MGAGARLRVERVDVSLGHDQRTPRHIEVGAWTRLPMGLGGVLRGREGAGTWRCRSGRGSRVARGMRRARAVRP